MSSKLESVSSEAMEVDHEETAVQESKDNRSRGKLVVIL
jgi:hypothetical protein